MESDIGAGNYGMCGRGFEPNFIFSWPNCRTATMGGEQAGRVLTFVAEERAARTGKEPDRKALEATERSLVE